MPTIHLETTIYAPIETCFDMARSIDLHPQTVAWTQERAVAGRTSGLFGAGETVTFEAVHFGIRQRLTSRMTEFMPPTIFADEMTQGTFHSLRHRHAFASLAPNETLMTDTMEFVSPLGVLGIMADKLFLERYMRWFLSRRNRELKRLIENKEKQV